MLNWFLLYIKWGFPDGSAIENLSAMQETQVWSLGQEDPLEKEMAAHSRYSCLGKSQGQRSLAGLDYVVTKQSEMTLLLNNDYRKYDVSISYFSL